MNRSLVWLILAIVPLLAVTCFAQTTTTYSQVGTSGGTVTYPFRASSIALDNNASISWLEFGSDPPSGQTYACSVSNSTPTGIGFIFVQNSVLGPDSQCFNLSYADYSQVQFSGKDENGRSFSATFTFSYSTYVSGTGRYHHQYFTLSNGVLTVTE